MDQKERVFGMLRSLGIDYRIMYHPAVYTVEQMDDLNITSHGAVCKNLFLRDAKGARHFLVVLDKDKRADLKSIQEQLSCTRLSFASEERLLKYLNLRQGEVTPLGVINDPDRAVEIVLDKDLAGSETLGFHPNDNTATVWISFEALMKIISHNGNTVHFVTI